jgi:DtxR family Mn-dependent transcriptional regulator
MMHTSLILLITFSVVLAGLLWLFQPGKGRFYRLQHLLLLDKKALSEDILKDLFHAENQEKEITISEILNRYNPKSSRLLPLIDELEDQGLIQSKNQFISLTKQGREYALQIIRVHRLFEKHLAENTGFAKDEWHARAEIAEHRLSKKEVENMSKSLGHPRFDPHGDPIPTASGEIRSIQGEPLTALPAGAIGRVIHIEDEPPVIYNQILAEEIQIGSIIRVLESDGKRIKIYTEGEVLKLSPLIAGNITVKRKIHVDDLLTNRVRLNKLKKGEKARIDSISKDCKGETRRRLLDLGFVPGTEISIELENPMRGPTAYSIRNTTIALRDDLAKLILIQPINTLQHE